MVAMSFPAEGRVVNFLGGDEACLHCIDSTLLSGSQWWSHVLSPVRVCRTNLTGSDSKTSTISWDVVTRRSRSRSVRFRGTHLADTFDIFRWSWIMVSALPHEICIVLAISSTFFLLSSLTNFSTEAITDGLTASDSRSDLGSSSSDSRPRRNSSDYLVTVL